MAKKASKVTKNQELEFMNNEISFSNELQIECTKFEDVKTLISKYSGTDETEKFELAPGQRNPLCAKLMVLNMIISCILRGEVSNIAAIIIGLFNDSKYIVDGLQRLSLLHSFITGKIPFHYVPIGINQKPQKTEFWFTDLSLENQDKIRNAKLEVRYIKYPTLRKMKEAIFYINTTSTPMNGDEQLAIFTNHEICQFLQKYDSKRADAYKFENRIPLKKTSSIQSDRSKSLALNVEFFMIAMYADFFKENLAHKDLKTNLTKFVKENMNLYKKSDFAYGKKAYTEIRKIMDSIASVSCDHKLCRYRAMWISLAKVYAAGNIVPISNSIPKVITALNGGAIWDTCITKVSGNSKTFYTIQPLVDHLITNVFDPIINDFDWLDIQNTTITPDAAKKVIDDENTLLSEQSDTKSIA